MKLHSLFTIASLVAVLAAASACKKQEDKGPPTSTASTGSSATGSASITGSDPEVNADHITVLAHHKDSKPSDPVRVTFKKFRVVEAKFDPKKLEGGEATLELDLSSLHTDSDERDDHLKSPAYFDVGKLAIAMITIDNVKPTTGTTYAADATVTAHGMTKTYPVTFDVIDTKDDRIRIKGQHTFARLDFGIGTDPAQNPEEQVGADVTIQMVLTLVRT
jgi:polyisoprenoid-binding protein YceI